MSLIFYPKSFKQDKYNLLREEPEGYSILIANLTLFSAISQKIADSRFENALEENLLEHLGGYLLEPNRLVDILLSFAQYYSKEDKIKIFELTKNLT